VSGGGFLARPGVRLFAGLWLLYGLSINSGNLEAFNLQQMGVEAIVERGRLSVDGSPTPQLQPGLDLFEYGGHLYAAKQPGQFLAGAAVYWVLHRLGLTYYDRYLLVAALVTFFTSSLATALAAACVYGIARDWTRDGSMRWALLAALTFGVAGTAFSYAGIAHHDALASAYLIVAFALVWRLSGGRATRSGIGEALGAGALLGWTITTSMLPFFMAVVVGAYFLSLRRWRLLPWFAAGGAAGLAPLLVCNWLSFGNPFLVPNFAGAFSDTYFFLDGRNFLSKLRFYARMTALYAPVVWLGLVGLAFLPRRLRREQVVLVAAVGVLLLYVLDIQTEGFCQYGPRYLLPAMPFAALGVAGFSHLARPSLRRSAAVLIGAAWLFAAAVNGVGAAYGAMYCKETKYGFAHYLTAIHYRIFRSYPLAPYVLAAAAVWILALLVAPRLRSHRMGYSTDSEGNG